MKKNTPRCTIIKPLQSSDKKKILRAVREKRLYVQGAKIRMATDFSLETIQAKRQGSNNLKAIENSFEKKSIDKECGKNNVDLKFFAQ